MMHGIGTTFICLCVCTFLHHKQGRTVAYVELNTSNEISSLSPHCKGSFYYKGVTYFPHQTVTSLPEILRMDYEYFILDMGVLTPYTLKEFLRCDMQFFICSLSKWKKCKTIENMKQLFDTKELKKEQFVVLNNLGQKESQLSLFSNVTPSVISFPFIPNPFHLDTGLFSVFYKFLKGV